MLNKDKNFVIGEVKRSRAERRRQKLSASDLQLEQEFIKEVNAHGYYIEYLDQIESMDKNDKILIPILIKYAPLFEYKFIYDDIISSLGNPHFKQATEFLISEFRKPNIIIWETPKYNWDATRRARVSAALYNVQDKRYVDDYIEFIENPETKNDTYFIIVLLGKLKDEKAFPVLVPLLHDENISLKTAAAKAVGYYLNHPETIPHLQELVAAGPKGHGVVDYSRWSIKRLQAAQEKREDEQK